MKIRVLMTKTFDSKYYGISAFPSLCLISLFLFPLLGNCNRACQRCLPLISNGPIESATHD